MLLQPKNLCRRNFGLNIEQQANCYKVTEKWKIAHAMRHQIYFKQPAKQALIENRLQLDLR
jgi:hypothetical protein